VPDSRGSWLGLDSRLQGVNYEDPNYNIGMPVFSIHGNHDDPSGDGDLCTATPTSFSAFLAHVPALPYTPCDMPYLVPMATTPHRSVWHARRGPQAYWMRIRIVFPANDVRR